MKTTLYPTLQETLHLHRLLIERHGGTLGVRDLGLIESALYRPQSGYYETLAEQGAALLQSFTMNHGFVDGNKRIAFALTAVFLRLNGYRLVVAAPNAEHFMLEQLIAGGADLPTIASWLGERMQPL